jgi:TPR repeat protein
VAGWAIAQHRLGEVYARGDVVERDVVQAFLWLQRAAQQHYLPAGAALTELEAGMTASELATAHIQAARTARSGI